MPRGNGRRRRYELSEAQWKRIADLMPWTGRQGGGPQRDHRQAINGLMWKPHTGHSGATSPIDAEVWCIDGSNVRASRAAAGGGKGGPAKPDDHALGRSRGGLGVGKSPTLGKGSP